MNGGWPCKCLAEAKATSGGEHGFCPPEVLH